MIVPTALVLLAEVVVPWTFNGPVPKLEASLALVVFNLGGALGLIPVTGVFCVGFDPLRTVFVPNQGARDCSSDSNDAFGSTSPYSSVVFVLELGSSGTLTLDAFTIVDALPCCTVAFKLWLWFRLPAKAFEPLLTNCRTPVLIASATLEARCVRPLGVRFVGAFTCSDVFLECCFILFFEEKDFEDFAIL